MCYAAISSYWTRRRPVRRCRVLSVRPPVNSATAVLHVHRGRTHGLGYGRAGPVPGAERRQHRWAVGEQLSRRASDIGQHRRHPRWSGELLEGGDGPRPAPARPGDSRAEAVRKSQRPRRHDRAGGRGQPAQGLRRVLGGLRQQRGYYRDQVASFPRVLVDGKARLAELALERPLTDCPPRRLINPEEILWLLAAQAPKVDFSK